MMLSQPSTEALKMDIPERIDIPTLDNHRVTFLPNGSGDWLAPIDPRLSLLVADEHDDGVYWVEDVRLSVLQEILESIYAAARMAPSPKMVDVMVVQIPLETGPIAFKAKDLSRFIHRVNNTRAEILSIRFGAEITDATLASVFFPE